ncbi:polyprenyl synthetase family protein [Parabacteroides sp. PF5-6]|uniref:polyprenyl synthetase family protein n=1 Tax=Parabacteroides sp. PF5-6 TaxID=1742403 RepID=UPI002404F2EF|nr:polyprenyl synthetase family protein [Parabacteroides sp. PF5-6]MDF9829042.1 geranylgeranyl diphosphate synthase type II [Parabacteroides sp. PF5-6]
MDNKHIYHIPQPYAERTRLRGLIDHFVHSESLALPLSMDDLSTLSDRLIREHQLDPATKGWIMVEINNGVWRETVASIPYDKRILLLPKCLSNSAHCQAEVDELGLLCHRCQHCSIPNLQDKADELGMMSLVAEGFTSVIGLIENRVVDTVIGVSCLDSLEKAFPLLINNAVPGLAIPLNVAGCKDTEVDYGYVEEMIGMRSEKEVYLLDYDHLKSTLDSWFSMENLNNLLSPADDLTSRVAREWLGGEGKRWRPYLLAATYMALNGKREIPKEVEWAAVAVECFHKASLVHDDIQDNDSTRYGKQTVHALHGEAIAINVGDLLLGYGYQLLARCGNMALIEVAAKAHADLCRGQGMELEWTAAQGPLTTDFVLEVFRLKTVPAFDVSLAMGVHCAGGDQSLIDSLHDYAEALGIAYQLFDDLEDNGMATAIDRPRELAEQYHRQALETLHRIPNTELRRLLFRVTQRILK